MDRKARRYAVVLAAGKGTRFKSEKPKVLHEICGRPMITYLLDRLPELGIERTWVVVGEGADRVREALTSYSVDFVFQERQLGTGHAVLAVSPAFSGLAGSLIVLYGDTPLIPTATLEELFQSREQTGADEVLLTVELENPAGYGRILRDAAGRICDIIEEKEATAEQESIREINAGFVCFDLAALSENLHRLKNDNSAGEYYLTDMVRILSERGRKVETLRYQGTDDVFGINDRLELASAERRMRERINRSWMSAGVTILDPATTCIDATVTIGNDTLIHPGALIRGSCRIGSGCVIGAYSLLQDSVLGDGVTIDHGSVVRRSTVPAGRTVPPHSLLAGGERLLPEPADSLKSR